MDTKFKGYQMDDFSLLLKRQEAPTLNFAQMQELLVQKVTNSKEVQ
jgi:hypothetical protein